MKREHLYPIAILAFCFASCRTYYVPNENATPMLSEQNQIIANVGASFGLRAGSISGSLAFAPTNHLGLVYQGSGYGNGGGSGHTIRGNFNEFGIGYFNLNNQNTLFELYLTHGLGKSYNNYTELFSSSNDNGKYTMEYNKTSLNFAIGKVEENFCFGFYTRMGLLNFNNISYQPLSNTALMNDLKDLEDKRNFAFFEPGLTAKFGVNNLKFYTKGGFCFLDQNYATLQYQQFQVTFGIQLELNKKKTSTKYGKI